LKADFEIQKFKILKHLQVSMADGLNTLCIQNCFADSAEIAAQQGDQIGRFFAIWALFT
jgi:hypothetical protein